VTEKMAEKLSQAGLATLADLLEKSAAELSEIPGIGEATAQKILEAARNAEEEIRNPRPVEEEAEEEEAELSAEEAGEVSAEQESELSGEEEGEPSQPAEETIVQE
jgi:NAD-dependent DNA ligase